MSIQRHWNLSFWPAEWICSLLLHFQLNAHSTPYRQVFLNALATQDLRKKKQFTELLHYPCNEGFVPLQKYGMKIPVCTASALSLLCHSGTPHNILANPGQSLKTHCCLPWHLSWPTRNTGRWRVALLLIQQWLFCWQHQRNLGKPRKAQNLWTGGIFRESEPCIEVVWGLNSLKLLLKLPGSDIWWWGYKTFLLRLMYWSIQKLHEICPIWREFCMWYLAISRLW